MTKQNSIVTGKAELEALREACRLSAKLRDTLAKRVKLGKTPLELNEFTREWGIKHGVKNALKGYHGFPSYVCISVNDACCHGVPTDRPFASGDVVKLDVSLKFDGYHGDTCTTVIVGRGTPTADKLLQVAEGATRTGINHVKPGAWTGSIGHEIESYVKYHEHQLLREFTGHGIGKRLHMGPSMPNWGRMGTGDILVPGMVVTVEPIIVSGSTATKILEDNWTVQTLDRCLAAQFEHTILVTQDGHEILT